MAKKIIVTKKKPAPKMKALMMEMATKMPVKKKKPALTKAMKSTGSIMASMDKKKKGKY